MCSCNHQRLWETGTWVTVTSTQLMNIHTIFRSMIFPTASTRQMHKHAHLHSCILTRANTFGRTCECKERKKEKNRETEKFPFLPTNLCVAVSMWADNSYGNAARWGDLDFKHIPYSHTVVNSTVATEVTLYSVSLLPKWLSICPSCSVHLSSSNMSKLKAEMSVLAVNHPSKLRMFVCVLVLTPF